MRKGTRVTLKPEVGETLDGFHSRVGQAGALMWAIKQGHAIWSFTEKSSLFYLTEKR